MFVLSPCSTVAEHISKLEVPCSHMQQCIISCWTTSLTDGSEISTTHRSPSPLFCDDLLQPPALNTARAGTPRGSEFALKGVPIITGMPDEADGNEQVEVTRTHFSNLQLFKILWGANQGDFCKLAVEIRVFISPGLVKSASNVTRQMTVLNLETYQHTIRSQNLVITHLNINRFTACHPSNSTVPHRNVAHFTHQWVCLILNIQQRLRLAVSCSLSCTTWQIKSSTASWTNSTASPIWAHAQILFGEEAAGCLHLLYLLTLTFLCTPSNFGFLPLSGVAVHPEKLCSAIYL